MNRDIVDTGKYLPVQVNYRIRVEGISSLDNTRVRLDVFQAKSRAVIQSSTTADQQLLPTGLQHLNNMANPTLNRLNSVFFKKYLSKQVFINSTKTDADTKGTTGNIKYIYFSVRPKRLRTQGETNPATPQDETPEVANGNWGPLNVPIDEPLWALLSTDDRTSIGDSVRVTMSRTCIWRDHIGSSTLQ